MSQGPQGQLRPAVFFDRDGTLVREVEGALSQLSQLEVLPGAALAVGRVNRAGFAACVITNQSAIARGWMDAFELERIHGALAERLVAQGAQLDLILHCPHLDSTGLPPHWRPCPCRKPQPGLLLHAAELLKLNLERSWVIGDALRDVASARAAGARGILVRTGKGRREELGIAALPDAERPFAVVDTVLAAVELLMSQPAPVATQGK